MLPNALIIEPSDDDKTPVIQTLSASNVIKPSQINSSIIKEQPIAENARDEFVKRL